MGKRSSFKRLKGDFYKTPREAVLPLIAHLNGTRRFAEPCCGDGRLVRHLESFGLKCVYAGDIRLGQDALARKRYGPNGRIDAIITNPPYTRPIMHPLIAHFASIAPTWLLMELDWAATRQAAPFLPSCSDIVVIGRIKWFPRSRHIGKQNFGWFRFDARHKDGPHFHPRAASGEQQHDRAHA